MSDVSAASPASSPDGPDSELVERVGALEQELRSLRSLLQGSLAILILLAAVLNLFLYQQTRILRAQGVVTRESVKQLGAALADHRTNTAPLIERFVGDMSRFAERSPDFAQILSKFPVARPTNATVRSPR